MLRVLSLFSGIGAFETALNEEDIDWELDHYCEIDKYACQSYNMVHGTTDDDNLKDVTNIDYSKIGHIDLLTYGFPCQDISLAGQQKGFVDEDGNVTRSGLFFSAVDIIRHTNPKFAIFENVKNLTSKKFKAEFETVLTTLDELGYNTYWKVLNAKDYGIPQNRERVFGISIRKDIDHGFKFPDGFPLKLRLKDMLEEEVDNKYYIKKALNLEVKDNYIQYDNSGKGYNSQAARLYYQDGLCPTLPYRNNGDKSQIILADKSEIEARVQQVGQVSNKGSQAGKVYYPDGLSPRLCAGTHGYAMGNIVEGPVICASRGRNPENPSSRKAGEHTEQRIEVNHSGCSNTLTTVQKDNYVLEPQSTKKTYIEKALDETLSKCEGIPEALDLYNRKPINDGIAKTLGADCGHNGTAGNMMISQQLRIRKLTPRECWRLMGFKDRYFDRVHGVSNTQLYKQAGNSIVVDVLRAIFREFKEQYPDDFQDWEGDL